MLSAQSVFKPVATSSAIAFGVMMRVPNTAEGRVDHEPLLTVDARRLLLSKRLMSINRVFKR